MEYTVVITKEPDAPWRAVVADLPQCAAEASTRDEVIAQIKERIANAGSHIEILKIEVPESRNGHQTQTTDAANQDSALSKNGSIWTYYGVFKDDPTWGEMMDNIERQRDQRMASE